MLVLGCSNYEVVRFVPPLKLLRRRMMQSIVRNMRLPKQNGLQGLKTIKAILLELGIFTAEKDLTLPPSLSRSLVDYWPLI